MKGIYHYLELNENLFTSGMPTAEQMREAAEAGVQIVVNLALATSQGVAAVATASEVRRP